MAGKRRAERHGGEVGQDPRGVLRRAAPSKTVKPCQSETVTVEQDMLKAEVAVHRRGWYLFESGDYSTNGPLNF